jgi:hypothetical protein
LGIHYTTVSSFNVAAKIFYLYQVSQNSSFLPSHLALAQRVKLGQNGALGAAVHDLDILESEPRKGMNMRVLQAGSV